MHSAAETGLRLLQFQLLDVIALRRIREVVTVKSAGRRFLISGVSVMSAGGTYVPTFLRNDCSNRLIKDAPLQYAFDRCSCCYTRYLNIEFSRHEDVTTVRLLAH
jgi:hypothetical protein